MANWNEVRPLAWAVAIAVSMTACSSSYDCANADVADALIEQASNSGDTPVMGPVPEDWKARLVKYSSVKNVVTLDKNEDIEHYRCKANLQFKEDARTVTSKDITFEIRKVEGDEGFTLEWEVENNAIATLDPIRMFALDVIAPWTDKLQAENAKNLREKLDKEQGEAKAWAQGYAIEYAQKNPPIPYGRAELKQHADDYLGRGDVEPISEQFHDIDGDGFEDYFTIFARAEFNPGEFAEGTQNYGEYRNSGGFMIKHYFFLAVTQPFQGFGRKTAMTLRDGKITTALGEKVTATYLPKDIAAIAPPPLNPIAGVMNENGVIVVSLTDGQAVTIEDFKPEMTLEQLQQGRMQDLERRLAARREDGGDLNNLYD